MADPGIAQLIGSLILALLTGTWQPAPADLTAAATQRVAFSGWWHPLDRPGNQHNLLVIGGDGIVLAGSTSSAVSPSRQTAARGD
jgi:hypothetical protein